MPGGVPRDYILGPEPTPGPSSALDAADIDNPFRWAGIFVPPGQENIFAQRVQRARERYAENLVRNLLGGDEVGL